MVDDTSYQPGDRVRVTVEGVVDEIYGDRKQLTTIVYASSETEATGVTFVNTGPGVAFERLAPAEWPPQAGDVWRDRDGDRWLAVPDENGSGKIMLADDHGAEPPRFVYKRYAPLTLVHREQQAAGNTADADEPACRICGCTENTPCAGGCHWLPDPEHGELCSAHFITAENLVEQQIVRCVDWHDGDPVRILHVQMAGEHYDETGVRYQDVAAHHPAVDVLVDRHHLVLPVGGGR